MIRSYPGVLTFIGLASQVPLLHDTALNLPDLKNAPSTVVLQDEPSRYLVHRAAFVTLPYAKPLPLRALHAR